jgi:DNA-binding IclR family transcriptional regulator
MAPNTEPVIGATERTFEIVELVDELGVARVSEVAEEIDIPTSTAHGYFQSLTQLGYLQRTSEGYRLGIRFLGLGESARRDRELYHLAQHEIDRLAEDIGEHANLMIEEHGLGTIVYKSKGENAVSLDTYPGVSLPLHATAMGKVIMANLPEARRAEIIDTHGLEAITENTIADEATLEGELEEIRDRGFARDDEERIDNIRCVAAPIYRGEAVIGSLSISGPVTRFTGELWEEKLPTRVEDAANIIQFEIKY